LFLRRDSPTARNGGGKSQPFANARYPPQEGQKGDITHTKRQRQTLDIANNSSLLVMSNFLHLSPFFPCSKPRSPRKEPNGFRRRCRQTGSVVDRRGGEGGDSTCDLIVSAPRSPASGYCGSRGRGPLPKRSRRNTTSNHTQQRLCSKFSPDPMSRGSILPCSRHVDTCGRAGAAE